MPSVCVYIYIYSVECENYQWYLDLHRFPTDIHSIIAYTNELRTFTYISSLSLFINNLSPLIYNSTFNIVSFSFSRPISGGLHSSRKGTCYVVSLERVLDPFCTFIRSKEFDLLKLPLA